MTKRAQGRNLSKAARAIAVAAACAAIAGAGALADGVVVSSTSSRHDVGDRVNVGRFITVEPGAEVAVLDRSGQVLRFSNPGARYLEPAGGTEPARAGTRRLSVAERLAASFTGLGRRAGLGTTRGGDEECEIDPGSRSIVPAECLAALAAAAEPWGFSVQSGFDGVMTCDYAEDGSAWRRLPLDSGAAPMPVGAQLYEFSSSGRADWPDAKSADVDVRCQAVDATAWSALGPHWRADFAPNEARAVMRTFARVSGGAFTEVDVEE